MMGALAAILVLAAAANPPAARPQVAPCGEAAPAVATPGVDGKTCNSVDLYYGLGRARDFEAARLCAYAERDDHEFFAIDGPGVLMMIHANGNGVPRDLERARQFACEMGADGLDPRLRRLEEMSADLAEDATPAPIDVCDHAVGAQTVACSALSSAQQALELDARYAALAKDWPDDQQHALSTLRERASAYFDDVVYAEGGLPAAHPAAMAMLEGTLLEQALFERLVEVSREAVPVASDEQAAAADLELNGAYGALLRTLRENAVDGGCGGSAVDATGIRDVQRLWIAYRDAWIAFGVARHPESAASSWNAMLTAERAQELRNVTEVVACEH